MKNDQLADTARSWLHANARGKGRLPKNLGTYDYRTLGAGVRVHPVLGLAMSEKESIGTVVHVDEEHFCVKEGRKQYCFADRSAFMPCPTLREGVNVVATPYNERDLDGIGLGKLSLKDQQDAPGAMLIGIRKQSLGVQLKTRVNNALAHQLCTLPMPDQQRTLLGALVDAGARRDSLLIVEDDNTGDYQISVAVKTDMLKGRFSIGYDCEEDLYWIKTSPEDGADASGTDHAGVYFDDIGRFIEEFVAPPPALGTIHIPEDQG